MWWWLVLAWVGSDWTVHGEDLSQALDRVSGMVVTETGAVYVLDSRMAVLYHLAADGREVGTIGHGGDGPGCMRFAAGLHYLPERQWLLVGDKRARKLQAYTLDGTPGKAFPMDFPKLVHIHILAGDRLAWIRPREARGRTVAGCSVVFQNLHGRKTRVLQSFEAPDHAAPFLAELDGARVSLAYPWDVKVVHAASWDGTTYFYGSNRTLEVVAVDVASGRVRGRIQGESRRPPLTEEEVRANPMKAQVNQTIFRATDVPRPAFKPAVAALFGDRDGRLWVRHAQAWGAPRVLYEVFSADGTRVGRLVCPADTRLSAADATHIYGYTVDPDTEEIDLFQRTYRLEPVP